MFSIYLQLGWEHILNLKGFDHLLFLVALCAPYAVNQWKQILILVTAFTIGHSLTLVISTLDIFRVKSEVVEFLIPITILATAIENVAFKSTNRTKRAINYSTAAFFGLIHGLAFSNDIRPMLEGTDEMLTDLLGFNLGIEIGQIIVVACIFATLALFTKLFNTKQQSWNLFLSGGAAMFAAITILENI